MSDAAAGWSTNEMLVELAKRSDLLEALCEEQLSMRELDQRLATSRSTIHRAGQSLAEHGILEKEGNEYALTRFGERLATETVAFRTRIETARTLDQFIEIVEGRGIDVPLEYFEDVEVVRPQPLEAHAGVKRITELIEETSSLRMFSSIISPFYVDVAHREMLNGTSIEVVFDSPIVDVIARKYIEQAFEALETGNFEVYVGEDVPFELFLAGETLGMAAHDETGLPRIFVETESPDAIRWGEDLYRRQKERAWQVTLEDVHPRPETITR